MNLDLDYEGIFLAYQKSQVLQGKIGSLVQMVNEPPRSANEDVGAAGPPVQSK